MAEKSYLCTALAQGTPYCLPRLPISKSMNHSYLHTLIKYYDHYVKGVDFAHLPDRESEAYRQLLLQKADEALFADGRYSVITDMTLDIFDLPELIDELQDLSALNKLRKTQRVRLSFYLDLKEVCYPLYRAQRIDWSAWPWLLNDGSESLDQNDQLYELITNGQYPCLAGVILADLSHRIFIDEDEKYSSVARQEASEAYHYRVKGNDHPRNDEDRKKLQAGVCTCAETLWSIENHTLVGREMGFDHLTQSLYDAFDTFIDSTYRHKQIRMARELADWIRQHMTFGEVNPAQEKVDALYDTIKALMARYDVSTPNMSYTWLIITGDVLGMSLFSEEAQATDDDEMTFEED